LKERSGFERELPSFYFDEIQNAGVIQLLLMGIQLGGLSPMSE
jgi:hypothetical protein